MAKILAIKARSILDSRGNPTVECDVKTENGISRASVPSGASTGSHEAVELRDNAKGFLGKGVENAVKNVNTIIARALKGKDPAKQEEIDKTLIKLDGTQNKSRLGANAILSASLACARAGALSQDKQLFEHLQKLSGAKKCNIPVPALNIINGGKHAGNKLDVQEYMIIPAKAKSFSEALRISSEIYHKLKETLKLRFGATATNVGDEGGFAPPLDCVEEPIELIADTIIKLGYWKEVKLGMDIAATSFWKGGKYIFEGKETTADALLERYEELAKNFPLVSIEDPFYEEDFEHFAELRRKTDLQIVGDDLLCTNISRIKKAEEHHSCNALLLKMNQIGTLSEALEAAKLAKNRHWNVMVSHRSAETEDNFIADLAVGTASGQIKAGAPCRGERLAKYNQLIRLEEQGIQYAGKTLRFS